MKTKRTIRGDGRVRFLTAAALVLLVTAVPLAAQAKLVVKAKVGPVTVLVDKGKPCTACGHLHRGQALGPANRIIRTGCEKARFAGHDRREGRKVWVPGRFVRTRHGARIWKPGHWVKVEPVCRTCRLTLR